MTFADRIIQLLNDKKISKNKLTSDLKLSKSSVYEWTVRGSVPNSETLKSLADYFNVSADYLLGYTDIKEKPIVENNDGLSDDMLFILEKLKKLDPSLLPDAKRYLDFLLASQDDK